MRRERSRKSNKRRDWKEQSEIIEKVTEFRGGGGVVGGMEKCRGRGG